MPQKTALSNLKILFLENFFVSLFITEKHILTKTDTVFLPDHDTEVISLSSKSVYCVKTSLNLCLEKHTQLDTLTVDHLLWKLNSSKCKIYASTSLIKSPWFVLFECKGWTTTNLDSTLRWCYFPELYNPHWL